MVTKPAKGLIPQGTKQKNKAANRIAFSKTLNLGRRSASLPPQ
jgi:hypothetical protein